MTPATDPIRISIFDMDRTITRTGTYSQWLRHWVKTEARWRIVLLPLTAITGLFYALRILDRSRLKEANQALLMGRITENERIREAARHFAETIVPDGCFADAVQRLAAEKAEGRRVMLATASYAFYVRAIAAKLGVDAVVATRVKRTKAGDIRAKISGNNCYGAAKLAMIEQHLAGEGIGREDAHIRFFSDHHSDLPTFAWADEAIAINGHAPMRRLAAARGWTRLNWR
ncbi:MAG: HAD family hydrolase [Pseudomonadota bacterium]